MSESSETWPTLAAWHARQMEQAARLRADSIIYYGVDPASETVVAMRRYDGGGVEVLAVSAPAGKPEDMWEGGDWLFHVARGT